MPRKPKPRWHAGNQQWVSDVGERYTDARGRARRRTVPFPGVARKDDRGAREALQKFIDAQEERERNGVDPTADTIFELYLEWLEAHREPSTYEAVSGLLSKFSAYTPPGAKLRLGERRASSFVPEDLARVLAVMAARHKPSYCAVLHSAVMAAFNWASKRVADRVPERLAADNPFRGVPKPTVPDAPERFAERKELADFLRWAWRRAPRRDGRGRASLTGRFDRLLCLLIRFAAHTGARPGELCIAGRVQRPRGFVWDYWFPDAGTNALGQRVGMIVLPPKAHKTGGKTGKPREIVVPPVLARALERHRAREWAHPQWAFTRRRGNGAEGRGATTAALGEPWTSAGLGAKVRKWRRLAIADGVNVKDEGENRFVLYRLRHTRITNLVSAKGGLSFDQAAALTGTSGKMILRVYGHLTGSRLIDLDDAARVREKGGQSKR